MHSYIQLIAYISTLRLICHILNFDIYIYTARDSDSFLICLVIIVALDLKAKFTIKHSAMDNIVHVGG